MTRKEAPAGTRDAGATVVNTTSTPSRPSTPTPTALAEKI
jgi:hypothetical protein